MFQQSRQGDLLAGGMQGSRGGGPADVHRLKGARCTASLQSQREFVSLA